MLLSSTCMTTHPIHLECSPCGVWWSFALPSSCFDGYGLVLSHRSQLVVRFVEPHTLLKPLFFHVFVPDISHCNPPQFVSFLSLVFCIRFDFRCSIRVTSLFLLRFHHFPSSKPSLSNIHRSFAVVVSFSSSYCARAIHHVVVYCIDKRETKKRKHRTSMWWNLLSSM